MSRLALTGAMRYRTYLLSALSAAALLVATFTLPEVPHATMFLRGFIPGFCEMIGVLLLGNWLLQERDHHTVLGWGSIFFAPTPSRSLGMLLVTLLSFAWLLYSQEVGQWGIYSLAYVSLAFVSGCALGAFIYRQYGPQARWLRIVYHLDRSRLDTFMGTAVATVFLGTNFYYLPTQAMELKGNGAMLFPLILAAVSVLFMLSSGLVAGAQSSKSVSASWLTSLALVAILFVISTEMAQNMLPSTWLMNGREYSANGVAWAVTAGIAAGLFAGITVRGYHQIALWYLKFLLHKPFKGLAFNVALRVLVNVVVPMSPVLLVSAALLFAYEVAGLYGSAVSLMGMLSNVGLSMVVEANKLKPSTLGLSMAQKRKLALVSPALDTVLRVIANRAVAFWNADAERPVNASI